jgi:hypothetical protein
MSRETGTNRVGRRRRNTHPEGGADHLGVLDRSDEERLASASSPEKEMMMNAVAPPGRPLYRQQHRFVPHQGRREALAHKPRICQHRSRRPQRSPKPELLACTGDWLITCMKRSGSCT